MILFAPGFEESLQQFQVVRFQRNSRWKFVSVKLEHSHFLAEPPRAEFLEDPDAEESNLDNRELHRQAYAELTNISSFLLR